MEIHVVYCADNNFVPVCATSIVSLLENKNDEWIHLYIIDNGIGKEGKKSLREIIEKYRSADIKFITFPDLGKIINVKVKVDESHLSISTYGRLFISHILPLDVKRFIYLDCDTIVLGSLCELYSYNLKGKIVGGVDDCKSSKYRWVLGLSNSSFYINAGVLLIDFEKWRIADCEKKIIAYIEKQNGFIHFEDQGTINAVLNDEILLLPMKFNVMTHNYDFTFQELMKFRKPVISYSESEIRKNSVNPVIIHYTSSFLTRGRAWQIDSDHKKKDLYLKYMEKTGFALQEKTGYRRKKLEKMKKNHLSRKAILYGAMLMHEYYEPLKYFVLMRRNRKR